MAFNVSLNVCEENVSLEHGGYGRVPVVIFQTWCRYMKASRPLTLNNIIGFRFFANKKPLSFENTSFQKGAMTSLIIRNEGLPSHYFANENDDDL